MAFLTNPPTMPIGLIHWDEIGEEPDLKARLLGHIRIGNLDMHLEAWAVTRDAEGIQTADPATQRIDDFDALCNMMDTSFQTIDIDGRGYILVATPYGD